MTTSYLLSLFQSLTVKNSFSFTKASLFSQLALHLLHDRTVGKAITAMWYWPPGAEGM